MDAPTFGKRSEDRPLSESWTGSASHISIDSRMFEQNPTFQLHINQKRKPKPERPIINSTKCQRLSFYRAYTASANKTEILCRHASQFSRFLWFYTFHLIFKSLPHTFTHMFLASYAPTEHIFLTKMVPFSVGFKYLVVAAGFFEVVTYIDTLLLMFYYLINGILFKNPWNRCKASHYFDKALNETVHCLDLEEFIYETMNSTYTFSGHTYKNERNESFQVAQVEYFRQNIGKAFYMRDLIYFGVLWSFSAFMTYHVSSRFFWKALHCCHWSIIGIDAITFVYLIITYITYQIKEVRRVMRESSSMLDFINEQRDIIPSNLLLADIDMLAESTTAPPVTHILTSRSTQPIYPSGDSTAIVLSNAALYIFRGLLTAKITKCCELLVNAPIYYSEANEHNFFFIWPIFYSIFYLGDIFCLAFLGFNFLTEILTVTVAFRCLIDTVVYEWTVLKPIAVIVSMFIAAIFMYSITDYESRLLLYIYAKGFATLFETIFLYIMYPLGRLVDDYTFHYGVSPTTLRKLSLQLVPFYYLVKFIIMMKALFEVLGDPNSRIHVPLYKWTWMLMVVPVVMGMIYAIYQNRAKHNLAWNHIFRPLSNWGPKDYSMRQLRKLYDSRHYITSTVPRMLSRHLISITESKIYKIDVRYESYNKRTDAKLRKKKKADSTTAGQGWN